MPFTRLFEVPSEPRDQWAHVVACLLALSQPVTRSAFLAELMGDEVAGADAAQVSERRPFSKDVGATVADVVVRAGRKWGIAIHVDLAFDVNRQSTWEAVYDALAETVDEATLVVITPDRKMPADVQAAAEGRAIRHKSWQRIRDWVQERPERGGVTGPDLLLLREADYFFNPRVAELLRLEEAVMPQVDPSVRQSFASLFLMLNDICPQPNIRYTSDSTSVVSYPRTGDAAVTLSVGDGDPVARIDGNAALTLASADVYTAGQSAFLHAATAALPPRR